MVAIFFLSSSDYSASLRDFFTGHGNSLKIHKYVDYFLIMVEDSLDLGDS